MEKTDITAQEFSDKMDIVIEDMLGDYPEWKRAMEKLTTQQVADAINYMLETNSTLFQGETLEGLLWIWREQQIKKEN